MRSTKVNPIMRTEHVGAEGAQKRRKSGMGGWEKENSDKMKSSANTTRIEPQRGGVAKGLLRDEFKL
jgi:hypothetical protein